MPKYSKEQLWKLYKELPEELKNAIFSEETADAIYDSCMENGVEEKEKISQVAENAGYVLLGLIAPEEFKKILSKEINIKKEVAEKIYQRIKIFVFVPVKTSLEKLYNIEIKSELKPKSVSVPKNIEKEIKEKDVYRELVK